MLIKYLLISAGTIFLFLGIIGIFVPGLPTTPFLLLTAGCYVRSSSRLHQKLIRNRHVGHYIVKWQQNRGLPLKTKITSLLLMWGMISISVVYLVESGIPRMLIVLAGLIGTLVMGFIIPTIRKS